MQPHASPDTPQTDAPSRSPSPTTALILLGMTMVLLGVNWPLMKIGLDSAGPLWFAVLRVATAGTVVGGIALLTGRLRPPPRRDWPVIASVGAGGIALNLVLVFTALQFVPAGRSSVLVWTAGLWTVPIAAVVLGERMTTRRWAGLIIGVAGIVLLFEPWGFAWSERDIVVGHALLIVSAVLQAAVIVHTRGHRWTTGPTAALPWQMLLAAVLLLVFAILREGVPSIDWSPGFGAIVAYQAMLATGFAAWAKQIVTLSLRATTVSMVLMGVPLVGLMSSMIILGERVGIAGYAGVTAIAVGVALSLLAERAHLSAMPPGDRPIR